MNATLLTAATAVESIASKATNHLPVVAATNWDINNVFKNTGSLLRTIGSGLMVVVGIVMIIVGIVKIAQGLISHGKTQVNWVINILLIIVGALFCAGGVFFSDVLTASDSNGLGHAFADTLNGLGN